MRIICLDKVGSTNSWLVENELLLDSPVFVYAVAQFAGRGQRGNSWEAQPGKNLTGSLMFHPRELAAGRQFLLSEGIALAILDTLDYYGIGAVVKWPNDIYVGDKKICGILIENVVEGKNIKRTMAGIGINVNQEVFTSNAPNPVSMKQITGKEYDIDEVADRLTSNLMKYISEFEEGAMFHDIFMTKLWRNDNLYHSFHDKKRDIRLNAKITDVSAEGLLSLSSDSGEICQYAFKEIEFIL